MKTAYAYAVEKSEKVSKNYTILVHLSAAFVESESKKIWTQDDDDMAIFYNEQKAEYFATKFNGKIIKVIWNDIDNVYSRI